MLLAFSVNGRDCEDSTLVLGVSLAALLFLPGAALFLPFDIFRMICEKNLEGIVVQQSSTGRARTTLRPNGSRSRIRPTTQAEEPQEMFRVRHFRVADAP
jgi:hypothetical protein